MLVFRERNYPIYLNVLKHAFPTSYYYLLLRYFDWDLPKRVYLVFLTHMVFKLFLDIQTNACKSMTTIMLRHNTVNNSNKCIICLWLGTARSALVDLEWCK